MLKSSSIAKAKWKVRGVKTIPFLFSLWKYEYVDFFALQWVKSTVFRSVFLDDHVIVYLWCFILVHLVLIFPPLLIFKECIFKKASATTGLRVFWSGTLRLYNCHACCRRWYFTFNGAECSTPGAIDGVVYMVHGNGAKKDLHRPRHIEGVCEKIHKGTVRVGFWVGNCAGYGSADAYTGWNSVSRLYVEEVPPPQA